MFAPFLLCQAGIHGMRRKGWGRIVNMSSIWGRLQGASRVLFRQQVRAGRADARAGRGTRGRWNTGKLRGTRFHSIGSDPPDALGEAASARSWRLFRHVAWQA